MHGAGVYSACEIGLLFLVSTKMNRNNSGSLMAAYAIPLQEIEWSDRRLLIEIERIWNRETQTAIRKIVSSNLNGISLTAFKICMGSVRIPLGIFTLGSLERGVPLPVGISSRAYRARNSDAQRPEHAYPDQSPPSPLTFPRTRDILSCVRDDSAHLQQPVEILLDSEDFGASNVF